MFIDINSIINNGIITQSETYYICNRISPTSSIIIFSYLSKSNYKDSYMAFIPKGSFSNLFNSNNFNFIFIYCT